MNLELRNIVPEKGIQAAYTANVFTNGVHFLKVKKLADKPLPDLEYTSHTEAPAFYQKAQEYATQTGFQYLHQLIQHLYVTRNDVKEAESLRLKQTKAMQELCATACVFMTPRHKAGEYEVSREAPTPASAAKLYGIDTKGVKKIAIDSPLHREFITRQYAEVGTPIVRWLGDDYPKPGQLL